MRLFYSTAAVHVLFDVFFRSLPILLNIFGLTALVFFMYAVLGMNLFGAINTNQSSLNRQAHFSSFGVAMLTLLRVATGDDWTLVMHEAMVRGPAGVTSRGHFHSSLRTRFRLLPGAEGRAPLSLCVSAALHRCSRRSAAGTTRTPTTAAGARRAAAAASPFLSCLPRPPASLPTEHLFGLLCAALSIFVRSPGLIALSPPAGRLRLLPLFFRRWAIHHAKSFRRCACQALPRRSLPSSAPPQTGPA